MIARRLLESLLFIETSSRTDADREYADAIKRVIEEHSRMREALEAIRSLFDSEEAVEIATDVLKQTVSGDTVKRDLELRDTLLKLSDILLEHDGLQKERPDRLLFSRLLHKLTLRQPAFISKAHHGSHPKH